MVWLLWGLAVLDGTASWWLVEEVFCRPVTKKGSITRVAAEVVVGRSQVGKKFKEVFEVPVWDVECLILVDQFGELDVMVLQELLEGINEVFGAKGCLGDNLTGKGQSGFFHFKTSI